MWDGLMESLTDNFIEHTYGGELPMTSDAAPPPTATAAPSSTATTTPSSSAVTDIPSSTAGGAPSASADCYEYTLDVYDLFSLDTEVTIQRSPTSLSPALDLVRHGYIAKTPTRPSVAVSIKTLQLLYRFRQRKPSISMESFAKVLCDYYGVRDT